MKSYVFRTNCGRVGYFQKVDDVCNLYVELDYISLSERKNWKNWERYELERYDTAPNCSAQDPMAKAVSFFLWNHCESVSPDIVEFRQNPFKGGTYYPRINRDYSNLHRFQIRGSSFVDELRAYYNIVESMEDIFKVVEPVVENSKAYGHRIREVLTIACTEVEYLLLRALKDNGYEEKRQYRTTDYVKLLPIYGLGEYEVEVKMHPRLGRISPFKDWNPEKPTKSLFWYDAYNSSKHDRGGNFQNASIEAMVNSVAAIHILLEAQYGLKIFDKPMCSTYESSFYTLNRPNWNIEDILVPKIDEAGKLVWDNEAEIFS